jgi:type I restriction enzyme M protein
MSPKAGANGARRLASPQSVNAAVKSICDVMRRSNCASALQYEEAIASPRQQLKTGP